MRTQGWQCWGLELVVVCCALSALQPSPMLAALASFLFRSAKAGSSLSAAFQPSSLTQNTSRSVRSHCGFHFVGSRSSCSTYGTCLCSESVLLVQHLATCFQLSRPGCLCPSFFVVELPVFFCSSSSFFSLGNASYVCVWKTVWPCSWEWLLTHPNLKPAFSPSIA